MVKTLILGGIFVTLGVIHPVHGASDDALAEFDLGGYVNLRFNAQTIAERPPMVAGLDVSTTAVEIRKTKNWIKLNLYYSITDPAAPAFIEVTFNARRNNHAWTEIHLIQAADRSLSEEINRHFLEAVAIYQASVSTKLKGLTLLPDGTISFSSLLEKGRVGNEPLLMSVIYFSIPADNVAAPQGTFPAFLHIDYIVYDEANLNQSVRYSKIFSGIGEVQPTTPETLQKIRNLLSLQEGCNGLLSSPGHNKKAH